MQENQEETTPGEKTNKPTSPGRDGDLGAELIQQRTEPIFSGGGPVSEGRGEKSCFTNFSLPACSSSSDPGDEHIRGAWTPIPEKDVNWPGWEISQPVYITKPARPTEARGENTSPTEGRTEVIQSSLKQPNINGPCKGPLANLAKENFDALVEIINSQNTKNQSNLMGPRKDDKISEQLEGKELTKPRVPPGFEKTIITGLSVGQQIPAETPKVPAANCRSLASTCNSSYPESTSTVKENVRTESFTRQAIPISCLYVSCIVQSELNYVSQDAPHIPPVLYRLHGPKVKSLDMSHNALTHLRGLDNFTNLEELVLDSNQLDDSTSFPVLRNLHTISINNNKITKLERFLSQIKVCAPSIKYLSMLGNAACPSPLTHSDKDEIDYKRYRCYVLYCLPGLNFLDSSVVKNDEREEGLKRGQYMKIARPQYKAQAIKIEQQQLVGNYSPLPPSPIKKSKGIYSKCNYKYNGLQSEGNRFIKNKDL